MVKMGFRVVKGLTIGQRSALRAGQNPGKTAVGFQTGVHFRTIPGKRNYQAYLWQKQELLSFLKTYVMKFSFFFFSVVALLNSFTVLNVTYFHSYVCAEVLWFLMLFHRLKMVIREIPGSFLPTAFK